MGLVFTNPVGTGGVCDVCLCFSCGGVGDVGGGVGRVLVSLSVSGRVGWCYVCVCCESGLAVEMEGPSICVLCSADTCAS